MKQDKTTKTNKPLISFSFYYKGREYVIHAVSGNEARNLFNKLIKTT